MVENNGAEIMSKAIALHEGVIRPSLVAELEAFRAPERRVSSYYLNLDSRPQGNAEEIRRAVKKTLEEQRERLDQLDVRPELRHALHRDWEQVQELALLTGGQRRTRSLACFVRMSLFQLKREAVPPAILTQRHARFQTVARGSRFLEP
jgi:hypothetical protein